MHSHMQTTKKTLYPHRAGDFKNPLQENKPSLPVAVAYVLLVWIKSEHAKY